MRRATPAKGSRATTDMKIMRRSLATFFAILRFVSAHPTTTSSSRYQHGPASASATFDCPLSPSASPSRSGEGRAGVSPGTTSTSSAGPAGARSGDFLLSNHESVPRGAPTATGVCAGVEGLSPVASAIVAAQGLPSSCASSDPPAATAGTLSPALSTVLSIASSNRTGVSASSVNRVHIPAELDGALEAFRMAATNLPLDGAALRERRAALRRAMLSYYGAKEERRQVRALFRRRPRPRPMDGEEGAGGRLARRRGSAAATREHTPLSVSITPPAALGPGGRRVASVKGSPARGLAVRGSGASGGAGASLSRDSDVVSDSSGTVAGGLHPDRTVPRLPSSEHPVESLLSVPRGGFTRSYCSVDEGQRTPLGGSGSRRTRSTSEGVTTQRFMGSTFSSMQRSLLGSGGMAPSPVSSVLNLSEGGRSDSSPPSTTSTRYRSAESVTEVVRVVASAAGGRRGVDAAGGVAAVVRGGPAEPQASAPPASSAAAPSRLGRAAGKDNLDHDCDSGSGTSSDDEDEGSTVSSSDSGDECANKGGDPLSSVSTLQSMQEVIPGLWCGSYVPAMNKAYLKDRGITHICCCVDAGQLPFPEDFMYFKVPVMDSLEADISRYFARSFEFIENALIKKCGAVLVHCGAGISRAPTITAAYLIRKLRLTSAAAIALVQQRRPFASPNANFRRQLRDYAQKMRIAQLDAAKEAVLLEGADRAVAKAISCLRGEGAGAGAAAGGGAVDGPASAAGRKDCGSAAGVGVAVWGAADGLVSDDDSNIAERMSKAAVGRPREAANPRP